MNNQAFLGEDAETLYQVGRRFLRGDGLEQNLERARQLLGRAAANGHPIAARLMEELKAQEPSAESKVENNASETTVLSLLNDIKKLEENISSALEQVRQKQQELEALLKK